MTKKHIILILLGLAAAPWLHSQQDPMFTQYMFNTLSINPAYAGSADALSVTAIHRSQWVGLDGAPLTQTLTGHSPLRKESISLGGSVVNDRHGPVKQTGLYADLSYRIFFDNSKLAFGLKGGINLFSANLLDLNPFVKDDPTFSGNISAKGLPNFGFGMMWYSRRTYVGLAVPKILENQLIDGNLPVFDKNQERQHYFISAGTVIELSNYTMFKPSLLLKAVNGAPPGFDLSANFLFYEKMWVGAAYRWQDAVSLLVQYEVNNKLKFGYSYDYTTSKLNRVTNGSHEIMIGWDIGRKNGGDVSPRYF